MKKLSTLLLIIALLVIEGYGAFAGTYDLQFSNPSVDCSGAVDKLCITAQIRSQSGNLTIGSHTIFINYNTAALRMDSLSASIVDYTPINFKDGACPGGGSNVFYTPRFTYDNDTGEGNMTTNMQTVNTACPTVTTSWIDIGTFCFEIVNIAQMPNLSFSTEYTMVNLGTNLPAHTQGTLTGYNVALACPPASAEARLKVFLEGPYSTATGIMGNALRSAAGAGTVTGLGLIPAAHPYSGAPWNYAGVETAAALPTNAVDWVLVDVTTSLSAPNTNRIARRAAILLQNGDIIDVAGSTTGVTFTELTIGTPYYFIVRHRNHIAVITSATVSSVGNVYTYNYTTAAQTVGTVNQQKAVGSIFAMKTGNASPSVPSANLVNSLDKIVWSNQTSQSGYKAADFNFDKTVSALDKLKWSANNSQGGLPVLQY